MNYLPSNSLVRNIQRILQQVMSRVWRSVPQNPICSMDYTNTKLVWIRPCSHHTFGTGTVPERNRAPVFTPVPLRPVVPERADHLAMWSQWNGSGTGPVGSVVWTHDWTRSGTVPVARDIRRFPAHSSYLQTFISSWHLATDRLIGDKSRYSDWSG